MTSVKWPPDDSLNSTSPRNPDDAQSDPYASPSPSSSPPPPHPQDRPQPRSLGDALRAAGIPLDGSSTGPGSETPSEEDYDDNVRPALRREAAGAIRWRKGKDTPLHQVPEKGPLPNVVRKDSGIHIYPDSDEALQDILKRGSEIARERQAAEDQDPQSKARRRRGKFRELLFSRSLSAFDRHNANAANSPFHGFYTLFWMAVALFVFKISADNWRTYGSPLGSNEIMTTMFSKDVFVLLLSDGVMCGLTGVTWAIQKLVHFGLLNWDREGWILQSLWEVYFMTSVVGWTLVRDWPWTHTVFFVLHGIVMLMKQHSYAFYNGYLSSVYSRRRFLLSKMHELEEVDPASTPSRTEPSAGGVATSHLSSRPSAQQRRMSYSHESSAAESDIDKISKAIASREPLDDDQIRVFERVMKWEIDALADELQGTASDAGEAYPGNLTFMKHYKWIPLPTLVYELEYPRTDSISWSYVAEKLVAMVGILFVMIQVSQYSIYPVVMKTVEMKEIGMPLTERFMEFPWMLSDLVFPFMMEYLLVWYLIWETILNVLAELTFFADRSFYDAWWNSVSWDQFARDWNRPVHIFLLRHVYHSSISTMKVNKHTATLITFFLSACIHELVMWCLFKKLRGYLLIMQMCQVPLVQLSRTRWLRGRKTLGNLIFWLGIFTGPSLLCSLYLIL